MMGSYLRTFFAWSYSQFFVGGLFATGVATLTYSHFLPADIFFSAGGLWAVIYWQASDHLTDRANKLRKQRDRLVRKPGQQRAVLAYSKARRAYWLWNLSGSSILVILTSACLLWTYRTQTEYELSLSSGWLIPASDPTPDAGPCGAPPPDALMLYLGNEAVIAQHFPHPVLTVSHEGIHEDFLTLFKNPNGSVAVSVDILSGDKKLIARLEKNRFTVNVPNTFRQKRPDSHSLIVEDVYGKEVLNIRYLNPRALKIKASLWLPEIPAVYGPWPATDEKITGCMSDSARIDFVY
jgi:hypothetical protein